MNNEVEKIKSQANLSNLVNEALSMFPKRSEKEYEKMRKKSNTPDFRSMSWDEIIETFKKTLSEINELNEGLKKT